MSTTTAELDRLNQRWERFRSGRNSALASDHGWLTLTSLQWLPAPDSLERTPGFVEF